MTAYCSKGTSHKQERDAARLPVKGSLHGGRKHSPACEAHTSRSQLSRGIVKHPFFLARPTDTWQTPKDPNTCFRNIGSISKRKIPGGLQGIVDAYGNEGNQVNRKKGRCWEVKGGPQLQCPTREGQQKQSRWTPPGSSMAPGGPGNGQRASLGFEPQNALWKVLYGFIPSSEHTPPLSLSCLTCKMGCSYYSANQSG